ncbi:lipid II flippase MurJ [Cellulomonas hominis]|uniref:lipid II flippase MurJ n=1 Tax=Cellulomonas hominis TaxID=156981 RepID=UPI001443AA63|nr:virulence factor MviN [Cellulomonas hominis]
MSRRGVLSGLAGAAALISVVTVVSRLLGFARNLVFANAVGAEAVGDAYNWANTLPNVLFEVAAGGALAGALIPVIAGPLARGMRDDVSRIASGMLGWTLGGLTLIGAALALAAHPIAVLADLGSPAERDLVAFFIRVFAVQLPLYGLAVVLSGVLQAQKKFFWPAFAPVLSSLVVIATYAGYGRLLAGAGLSADTADVAGLPPGAAELLAWGTTAGVLAMGLPLLVPVWRSGVRLRLGLRFPEGVASRARSLALAGIGGLVAQQVSVLATITLSRRYGGDGALTVFQSMVQPTYLLPYAVLAVPLATSTFPRLAAAAARADRAGYAPLAAVTTRAVLVAGGAGAALLAAVAPAVATVFSVIGSGRTELIASMDVALTLIAPGLLGLGLIFHVSRALYALERGRLAVLAVSSGWATVVVASWVACAILVPGAKDGPATLRALGIGTSTGMLVAAVVLVLVLRAAAGAEAVRGILRTSAVLLVGGTVGAVVGRWTVDTVQALTDGLPGAIAAAAGGGAVAGAVVVALVWGLDRTTLTGLVRRGGAAVTPADVPLDAAVPGTLPPEPPTHDDDPARKADR